MSQPKVRGAPHFIPPPYSDLIAIICRSGFPNALSSKLTESEGNTVLWVQSRIMGSLDPSLRDRVGLEVRHRQVGAILRQAEENRDLVLEQACHNPDGEIYHDEVRVEVRLETLSSRRGLCRIASRHWIAPMSLSHVRSKTIRMKSWLADPASRPL